MQKAQAHGFSLSNDTHLVFRFVTDIAIAVWKTLGNCRYSVFYEVNLLEVISPSSQLWQSLWEFRIPLSEEQGVWRSGFMTPNWTGWCIRTTFALLFFTQTYLNRSVDITGGTASILPKIVFSSIICMKYKRKKRGKFVSNQPFMTIYVKS